MYTRMPGISYINTFLILCPFFTKCYLKSNLEHLYILSSNVNNTLLRGNGGVVRHDHRYLASFLTQQLSCQDDRIEIQQSSSQIHESYPPTKVCAVDDVR